MYGPFLNMTYQRRQQPKLGRLKVEADMYSEYQGHQIALEAELVSKLGH